MSKLKPLPSLDCLQKNIMDTDTDSTFSGIENRVKSLESDWPSHNIWQETGKIAKILNASGDKRKDLSDNEMTEKYNTLINFWNEYCKVNTFLKLFFYPPTGKGWIKFIKKKYKNIY